MSIDAEISSKITLVKLTSKSMKQISNEQFTKFSSKIILVVIQFSWSILHKLAYFQQRYHDIDPPRLHCYGKNFLRWRHNVKGKLDWHLPSSAATTNVRIVDKVSARRHDGETFRDCCWAQQQIAEGVKISTCRKRMIRIAHPPHA